MKKEIQTFNQSVAQKNVGNRCSTSHLKKKNQSVLLSSFAKSHIHCVVPKLPNLSLCKVCVIVITNAELLRTHICVVPTVQKLQDHLPALCRSLLLHLCGRD